MNPYLMLATVLGAALAGIEDATMPPAPITGNAYELTGQPQLAANWGAAIDAFATSPLIARILPAQLIANLCMTKRQELTRLADRPADRHWLSYLETV